MMLYLIERADRMFVKGSGFLSFAKYMRKSISKNINKTLAVNTAKSFLNILRNLLQMHVELFQKNK